MDRGPKLMSRAILRYEALRKGARVVPLFFRNRAANSRLSRYEAPAFEWFARVAGQMNGVEALQFGGADQAQEEMSLAILGLSRADPKAWLRVADLYVWGSYEEIPVQRPTALDDLPVRIHLEWLTPTGMHEKFVGETTVSGLETAIQVQFVNILANAKPAPLVEDAPEIAKQVSDELFARALAFLPDELEEATGRDEDSRARHIGGEVRRRGDALIPADSYLARLVTTACFFDPADPDKEAIRLLGAKVPEHPVLRDAFHAECISWIDKVTIGRHDAVFGDHIATMLSTLVAHPPVEWGRSPYYERPERMAQGAPILTRYQRALQRGSAYLSEHQREIWQGERLRARIRAAENWIQQIGYGHDLPPESRTACFAALFDALPGVSREWYLRHRHSELRRVARQIGREEMMKIVTAPPAIVLQERKAVAASSSPPPLPGSTKAGDRIRLIFPDDVYRDFTVAKQLPPAELEMLPPLEEVSRPGYGKVAIRGLKWIGPELLRIQAEFFRYGGGGHPADRDLHAVDYALDLAQGHAKLIEETQGKRQFDRIAPVLPLAAPFTNGKRGIATPDGSRYFCWNNGGIVECRAGEPEVRDHTPKLGKLLDNTQRGIAIARGRWLYLTNNRDPLQFNILDTESGEWTSQQVSVPPPAKDDERFSTTDLLSAESFVFSGDYGLVFASTRPLLFHRESSAVIPLAPYLTQLRHREHDVRQAFARERGFDDETMPEPSQVRLRIFQYLAAGESGAFWVLHSFGASRFDAAARQFTHHLATNDNNLTTQFINTKRGDDTENFLTALQARPHVMHVPMERGESLFHRFVRESCSGDRFNLETSIFAKVPQIDPNGSNSQGRNPLAAALAQAAAGGDFAPVHLEMMLALGCDSQSKDAAGKSALDYLDAALANLPAEDPRKPALRQLRAKMTER